MVKNLITKPIVFVGMMGSGKSTIGKKLAKKLNLKFYDTDRFIEEREGLTITDIYDFKGEKYFQQQEEKVIEELLNYGVIVLSTGGNSFVNPKLHKFIKERAISIFLSADIETLYERIARRNTRPEFNSIEGDKKEVLKSMISERNNVYSDSDIIIESNNLDAHYIVDTIMVKLKQFINSPNIFD